MYNRVALLAVTFYYPTTLVQLLFRPIIFLPPLKTCSFSLLLLEFGEIYFEDYGSIYYPNASTESESIDRSVSYSCSLKCSHVEKHLNRCIDVECVHYHGFMCLQEGAREIKGLL